MSGKYRAFFDVLTGFFFGASAVKIYSETISTEEDNESIIFRKNKKRIGEICASHENLKVGKSERVIQIDRKLDNVRTHEVFRFGQPRGTELLYYKNHVLAYDSARKVPLWVAQHLTKDKLMVADIHADRSKSSFQPDPNIPEIFQAKNDDYYKSGWTRGHMAPAGIEYTRFS